MWLCVGRQCEYEHKRSFTLDIRQGIADIIGDIRHFPLQTESLAGIELIHVIEHIERGEASKVIKEIWRVLRLGGELIIAAPDLEQCARRILEGQLEILANIYSPSDERAQQHRWGYTLPTLLELVMGQRFHCEWLPHSPRDRNEMRMRAVKI